MELDIIRNERIRGTTKVGEISKKVQQSRLKWYGYVLRREEVRSRQESDGGAVEKKERKTEAEMVLLAFQSVFKALFFNAILQSTISFLFASLVIQEHHSEAVGSFLLSIQCKPYLGATPHS